MTQDIYRDVLPEGYLLHWYRIQSVLGRGAYGVTYLAHDQNLDQFVAIKEYFPMDFASRETGSTVRPTTGEHRDLYDWGLDRFIKEARTLARFRHPNIVRVLSVFEYNDTAYMIMEYERGQDLSKVYKQKQLNEQELLAIYLPVLDGLRLVHEAGFIHRDVKPSNIYIREDGSPVLIDFGSARKAGGAQAQSLTSLVTYGFAPFEQYTEGEEKQGPWTDIYALGASLYLAVTGKLPAEAMTRGSKLLSGRPDPFEPASQLAAGKYSEHFLLAIDRALMFHSKDRPRNVVDWADMLSGKTAAPPLSDKTAVEDLPLDEDDATVVMDHVPFSTPPHIPPSTGRESAAPPSGPPTGRQPQRGGTGRTAEPASEWPSVPEFMKPGPQKPQQPTEKPAAVLWGMDKTRLASWALLGSAGILVVVLIWNFFAGEPAEKDEQAQVEPGQEERETDVKQPDIAALLEQANQAYEEGKIIEPAGENALQLYRQVIQSEPGHSLARERIDKILNGYAEMTRGLMERNNFKEAGRNIQLLSQAAPDSPVVQALQQELQRYTQPGESIDALLQQARRYMDDGRWVTPVDGNALATFRKVLDIDSGNKEALQGIEQVKNHFKSLAEQYIDQSNWADAEHVLDILRDIDPDAGQTRAVAGRLKQARQQQAASEQLNDFLDKADRAFKAGDVISPYKRNALYYYGRALRLDRDNRQARRGIERIESYLEDGFKQRIAKNQFVKAEMWVKSIERAWPRSNIARSLRRHLEQVRPERKPEIDYITDLVGRFKAAFESRNKRVLSKISEYQAGREAFVKQLFTQYLSFKITIENFRHIGRQHKGVATVRLSELVNVQGATVQPGAWANFEIEIKKNQKGQWKVFW